MPSRASWIQVSVETTGFRNIFLAESFTRAQWSSRSGVTPSKARAPSNTSEQSQAAWVRGPMIGTLPSCHLSSKYVQVFDQPSLTAIETPRFARNVSRGIPPCRYVTIGEFASQMSLPCTAQAFSRSGRGLISNWRHCDTGDRNSQVARQRFVWLESEPQSHSMTSSAPRPN